MKKFLYLLAICLFILQTSFSYGANERVVSGKRGTQIDNGAFINVSDQWYTDIVNGTTTDLFTNEFQAINVVFYYDESLKEYYGSDWSIEVRYTIECWDASGTNADYSTPPSPGYETLTITYDNLTSYNDKVFRQYRGYNKARLKITDVIFTGGAGLSVVPDDVFLDVECVVDRNYEFDDVFNTTVLSITDNSATDNSLQFHWGYIQGAESYDLEWLFIDIGDGSMATAFEVDFKKATRINTPNQHYDLNLVFPRGILIYRVRGVGFDANGNYEYGSWSYDHVLGENADDVPATAKFEIDNGLLPTMNWSSVSVFSENGKRAEQLSVMDGLMRPRQTVAVNQTENIPVISETIYDHVGRPAIQVIPSPAVWDGLTFYEDRIQYNTGSGSAQYTTDNFDIDSKSYDPDSLTNASGSSEYYSTHNPVEGFMRDYTPDAAGYPFMRVHYKNDGTDRVVSQSGVGENYLTDGSSAEITHDIKMFYGQPAGQQELDRLFGNEAGPFDMYKKQVTVDANGQASVLYLDNEGRVIATALAGPAPDNLYDIDTRPENPAELTSDLVPLNHLQSNEWIVNSTFTVAVQAEYTFTYYLEDALYCDDCLPGEEPENCVDCVYDLEIKLVNANTGDVVSSHIDTNITEILLANIITITETLVPGEYTITKILTLNQTQLTTIRNDFIENQICVTEEEVSGECNPDCITTCTDFYTYTNNDGNIVYVDEDGEIVCITDTDGDPVGGYNSSDSTAAHAIINACEDDCIIDMQPEIEDECTFQYNLLIQDVSPGGQYFDNHPDPANPDEWLEIIDSSGTFWSAFDDFYEACAPVDEVTLNDWNDVRTYWTSCMADYLVTFHPEYCAWETRCDFSCEIVGAFTVVIDNEDMMYYEDVMMEGDAGTNPWLFNPLNTTQSTAYATASDKNNYQPYASSALAERDPFFVCNSAARSSAQTKLKNFVDVGSGNYYSIWYVIDDPDDIAGAHGSGTSGISDVDDFFDQIHGDGTNPGLIGGGAGQISAYAFFRSVYMAIREQEIYEEQKSCPGLLLTSPNNDGITADGFVIRYLQNPVLNATWSTFDETDAEDMTLAQATNTCESFADSWMAQLSCSPALDPGDLADVRAYLISICANGTSDVYPYGSDNVANGNNNSVSNGGATHTGPFTTFSGVLTAYGCDPITHAPTLPEEYEQGSCDCAQFVTFLTANGLTVSSDWDDILAAMEAADLFLDTELGEIGQTEIEAWLAECEEATPDHSDLITDEFIVVFQCESSATGTIPDYEDYITACTNALTAGLQNSAHENFIGDLGAHTNEFLANYTNFCMDATDLKTREHFTISYELDEYHYTLYYYDQAGNLVRTVSPEGVFHKDGATEITSILTTTTNSVNSFTLQDVVDYRNNPAGNTFVHPNHTLVVEYDYNSLQQVVSQTTPDGGKTNYWYDYLGRLVISQDARQEAASLYSYTVYDALGRIEEAGEIEEGGADPMTNTISFVPANLTAWFGDAGAKLEVMKVFYDEPLNGTTDGYFADGQAFLRNRIATTTYEETDDNDDDTYDHASHYSYDVHGNVKILIQENVALAEIDQDLKKIEYEYDLVSGNVNVVKYQEDFYDEFYHQYYYDADNRVKEVYTSRDGEIWEKDADYFYYAHGALAREEIGEKKVAGSDFYYTLQGWIKGMNSATLYETRDAGHDSKVSETNEFFAKDAFGYTIGYHDNDYTAIDVAAGTSHFEPGRNGNSFINNPYSQLFNGNIGHIITAISDDEGTASPMGVTYRYDQLNRLKRAESNNQITASTNLWNSSYSAQTNYLEDNITYDGNGNILTFNRNGNSSPVDMDELTYNYSYDGLGRLSHNRLGYVDDAASGSYSGDIEDQSSANYLYDASGRLIQDKLEKIENANSGEITWNNQNKVRKIKRGTASDVSDIEYKYNNMGQRAVKIVKPRTGSTESAETSWSYTYYVYDASGNVMATYERAFRAIAGGPSNDYDDIFTLSEHDIYGSSRLGLSKTQIEKTSTFTATLTATDPEGFTYFTAKSYSAVADTDDEHDESTTGIILYERTLGEKRYELTNHLENVAEVISDRKIQVPNGGNTATDYFIADVKSYSDFYAFHSLKPGRNFTSDDYRYSVNGQEKETEITGTASHSSAEYWMYDSRIGRRWENDPIVYPRQSPFVCFNDNPILNSDPRGLEAEDSPNSRFLTKGASKKSEKEESTQGNMMMSSSMQIDESFATKVVAKLVEGLLQSAEIEGTKEGSVSGYKWLYGKYPGEKFVDALDKRTEIDMGELFDPIYNDSKRGLSGFWAAVTNEREQDVIYQGISYRLKIRVNGKGEKNVITKVENKSEGESSYFLKEKRYSIHFYNSDGQFVASLFFSSKKDKASFLKKIGYNDVYKEAKLRAQFTYYLKYYSVEELAEYLFKQGWTLEMVDYYLFRIWGTPLKYYSGPKKKE